MKGEYVAGQRNIGRKEVRKRRRHGFIGAAASILLFLMLVWADAPPLTRIFLALPLFASTLGFVQATGET